MNTNKLKTFARNARLLLLGGVTQRLKYWGFDEEGNVVEELEPMEGGYSFREDVFNDTMVPPKWNKLKKALQRHTADDIIEEAAYTWFNRLIAIKILEENGYTDPVLSYVSDDLDDPILLDKALKGEGGHLRPDEEERLKALLIEGDKDEEVFGLLLTAYCRNQKLLKRIFGHIDDYTELLLPSNLLSSGGIIEHINTSDAITKEDYQQVELIGWLYQFYITDKKNEIFAGFKQKKKARAEDIPAATQIFTPKWIVKYMVENTVGRIWLERYPDSPNKDKMKYLVEPADNDNYEPEPIIEDVTELSLLDPACGSGHILVVGFDLLVDMYVEEGYSKRKAAEQIIKNNLFGLDIDERAAQLANFAVLLKAAKYNEDILNTDIEPKIYSMPEPRVFSKQDVYDFLGEEGKEYADELEAVLHEMQQSKNVGSALKLNLSKEAKEFIEERNNQQKEETLFSDLTPYVNVISILTSKFHSVVANPPYMGMSNYNNKLKEYIYNNYSNSKSDLFSVFIETVISLGHSSAYIAMITQQNWMFLPTFKLLRENIIGNYNIRSLLHLGARTFEEISGEVVQSCSFSIKLDNRKSKGRYYQLINLRASEKEKKFLLNENSYKVIQTNFLKIPSNTIAYWISDWLFDLFNDPRKFADAIVADGQNKTSKNDKYLKLFWELDYNKVGKGKNYIFYAKGGPFRKWFGNNEMVVNWSEQARSFYRKDSIARIIQEKYWYRRGYTFSRMANKVNCRTLDQRGTFDATTVSFFINEETYSEYFNYFLGFFNSCVMDNFIKILNPTIVFTFTDVRNIPLIINRKEVVDKLVQRSLKISSFDWYKKETNYDFKKNELIRLSDNNKFQSDYKNYVQYWTDQLYQLHNNEEELNRIFIEIYGLEDELTPDVPLKDITILQDETYIDENNELQFKQDVIVQQFLSYAIGCMMGRYRLDKEGLQIAHPNPTEEEIAPYKITSPLNNGSKEVTFEIDEDAIIPMMGSESPFSDDIYLRIKNFVEIIWGEETLTENLNFINQALNTDLEKFLTKKFWEFHCKMYQKKPIYWLFSSPKGAFKVLVYMHRMNKYTVQKIRNNYLLKHLNYIREEITKLQKNSSSLSRAEAKRLDQLRADEIECREYDKLMKSYSADQIGFDLDDGVSHNYSLFEGILAKIK